MSAMDRVRGPLLSMSAAVLIAATLIATPNLASAAGPNLQLVESAPATVLYGTPATVTLTANNPQPSGGTAVYNVSFTDVIPLGTSYVPGSSNLTGGGTSSAIGDPTIVNNQPVAGKTTLIWSNVGDLQPSSTQALSFQIQGQTDLNTDPNFGPNPVLPGASYADSSAVYANTDPRYAPQFNPNGSVVTGATSYTDSATSSGTTEVVPLRATITEPSPEHELPRGVHDNQVTYSVTVTNNKVRATNNVSSTVFVPAGLEFLGCGGVDNTTAAANTGAIGALEYAGSGSLNVSAPIGSCPTPTSVVTVLNPAGEPTGVYTEVTWDASVLGNLAASASETFNFVAAVPLQENTTTFAGGTPTGLGEIANLNNNSGPETHDGESLTTTAQASGTYSGALGGGALNPVSAQNSVTVEAVDLAVQKTSSSGTFIAGNVATFTLHYETSEYRFSTGTVLTDTVPSGMCPVGALPADYTDSDSAECIAAAGSPSTPYSNVTENPDGTFTVTWNLATLPPNTKTAITYPVLDRAFYQNGTGPTTPTLIGDSLTNTTSITGTVHGTCYDGPSATPTPDPTCSNGGATIISGGESTPTVAVNGSQSSQSAPEPTLSKEVSQAVGPGGTLNCSSAMYLSAASGGYPPAYEAGDTICFQLQVNFPVGVYTHNALVTDFLPPNTTYVPGSAAWSTGAGYATVAGSPVDGGTSPDSLTFTLGDTIGTNPGLYVRPGQTFLATFALKATAPPAQGNNYTFVQNLMKLSAFNTAGQSVSLRSQVGYNLTQPVLEGLTKSVALINGSAYTGQHVQQGDQVAYDVGLTNTGLVEAVGTTVLDNLPSQITDCSTQVSGISGGGSCNGATQIKWTGVTVPAGTTATPGTTTLSYVMTVPNTVAAGEILQNHAGVFSYQPQAPNNGGTTSPTTYYPTSNIDAGSIPGGAGSENAPAADQTASVSLASPTISKAAAPTVNGPTHATIGEPIKYTLTAVVPGGTTLYNASIDDPLGSNLTYSSLPADATATVNGTPLPVTGFTLTHTASDVNLAFPSTFQTAVSTPQTIVVTFYAVPVNVGGPVAGGTVTNKGTFAWKTSSGGSLSTTSNQTSTTIVEPKLALTKTDSPGGAYAAGATVTYSVQVSNTGTSAANDIIVPDVLPTGMSSPVCVTTPSPWTCTVTGTGPYTITWQLPDGSSLAAGSNVTFTYTSNIPNPAVGTDVYTNSVNATFTSLPSSYPGARSYTSPTVTDTVHLTGSNVVKVASPTSVTNGVDTTYTVTVTVPPNLQFPNATAVDTLPDGMIFDSYGTATCTDSAIPSPSTCTGLGINITPIGTPTADGTSGKTLVGWWLGNLLDDSGTRTITLTYTAYPAKNYTNGADGTTVNAGATLTNNIGAYWDHLTAAGPPGTVPSPGTFDFSAVGTPAVITVLAPRLTISKGESGAPTPGAPLSYTVTVSNTGTSAAYDATVTDVIPAGLAAPSSISNGGTLGPGGPGPGTITWNLAGPIANGSNVTLTYTDVLAASNTLTNGESITNTAQVTTYYGVPKSTYLGDTSRYVQYGPSTVATATVVPVFPVLHLVKTPTGTQASINTPFTWTLVTTDTSLAPATNVAISDTLPAYWNYNGGSTTITQASGAVLTGAGADPSVSTVGNVETLTWTGVQLAALGASSVNSITVTYTATPQVGASTSNTNGAVATGEDATGAPGNASGTYPSASASATATIQADLSIAKTNAASFTAGGQGTYTLTVTNNGTSNSPGPIHVLDTLPAGETLSTVGGTGWVCLPGPNVDCTLAGGLAISASSAITLVVNVASNVILSSGLPTTLSNTATVSGPLHDPVAGNNSSTDITTIVASADLGIVKTHSGTDTFVPGTNVHYNLAVHNYGPSDAANPQVTDTLPAYLSYVSASGTGWNCSFTSPTVTCNATSNLVALADANPITVVAKIASGYSGTVANTATVSSATADPVSGNNSSSDSAAAATPSADLGIAKTNSGADTFNPGTDVHYTLAVHNYGPSDAANPQVTDTLPAYLSYVSASGTGWNCSFTSPTVTCNATSNLVAGTDANAITVVATIASGHTGSVSNTASVSSTTSDPVPANNSSTDTQSVGAGSADLSIVKTHAPADTFVPGTKVHYNLAVHNAGPSDAVAPTVMDTLPAYLTYVSATGAGWLCGDILGTVTCTATSNLVAGTDANAITVVAQIGSGYSGTVANTASVSSTTPDPVPLNNSSTDSASTGTPSADLGIAKTHAPTDALVPGTDVHYNLAVHNYGPSDAANPQVTDTLPAGLSYVSASGTGWNCSFTSPTVTCNATSNLVAGTDANAITVVAQIGSGYSGSFTNTASVSIATADPVPGNNISSDSAATATPSADLGITKTNSGADTFNPGTDVHYNLAVHNYGPSDAANPQVTDTLPAYLTYVSASGTGWNCSFTSPTVTCNATSNLVAGTDANAITVVATIASGHTGSVSNTASVSSTTSDPNPANNSSTDTQGSGPGSADLGIVKTHAPTDEFLPGTDVHFTLAIHNAGPSDAATPVVTDSLAPYFSYVSASGSGPGVGWACGVAGAPGAQVVTCTATGNLPAGADAQPITLVVLVGPGHSGAYVNTASVASTTPDPNTANNASTDSAAGVPGVGGISLLKTADIASFAGSGVLVTYSYKVTNTGTAPLVSVGVADPMAGLSAISCPVSSLAPAATETCTATYTTTAADVTRGSITNTATAVGTPPFGPKVSATSSVTVPGPSLQINATTACVKDAPYITWSADVQAALAALARSNGPRVSGPVTITWVNSAGDVVATYTDQPSSGTELWPGAAVDANGVGTAWPGWAVDAQGNWYQTTDALSLIRPVATVVFTEGQFSTTVKVGYPPATPSCDANPATTSSVTLVKSLAPSSQTSFTAAGQTLTYDYLVTNTGTTTLTGIAVSDNLIPTVSCPEPSLGPGLSETCTASYVTTAADVAQGSVTNTATATGTPPTGPPATSPPSTVTVATVPPGSLSLVKSTTTTAIASVGQVITYQYIVTDTGASALTAVTVADNKIPTSDISCPATSLQPGGSMTCTGTYTVTAADLSTGSVTNVATATGTDPDGAHVPSNPSTVTVGSPGLQIVKAVDAQTAAPGETVTYTVTVSNTGTAPYGTPSLPDAAFTDSLSGTAGDATYVAGSLHATSGVAAYSATLGITWSGPLGVGATATVTYQVRVKSPDTGHHVLTNTIVSASPGSSCGAQSRVATCSTRTPVADVTVSKQVCGTDTAATCGPKGSGPWTSKSTIGYGAVAYWRIIVANTGMVPITDVTITDAHVPVCAAAAGKFDLAVGAKVTIYCSLANVTKGFTNIAVVHYPAPPGAPPGSPSVPSTGTATVSVAQRSGSGGGGQKAPPVTG